VFPALHPIRPEADVFGAPERVRDEGVRLAPLEWRLQNVARQRLEVRRDERTCAWEGLAPAKDDETRVGSRHFFQLRQWRDGVDAEVRRRVDAPSQDEILGREGRAVLPGEAR